jgi:hypothetical protein
MWSSCLCGVAAVIVFSLGPASAEFASGRPLTRILSDSSPRKVRGRACPGLPIQRDPHPLGDAAEEKRTDLPTSAKGYERIIGDAGPDALFPEGMNRANIPRTTCAASRSPRLRLVEGKTSARPDRSSVGSDESA